MFTLTIDNSSSTSSATKHADSLASLISDVAETVRAGGKNGRVFDRSGQIVGSYDVTGTANYEVLTAEVPLDDEGSIPCPYPGCSGDVGEVDISARFNTLHVLATTDGGYAVFGGLGDINHQHDRYECDSCGRTVKLPDGMDVEDYS